MAKMNKKLKIVQKNSMDINRYLTKRLMTLVLSAVMMFVMVGVMPKIEVNAQSQADAIVSIALAEEGYDAQANKNNKYGQALGQNNVDWCALFISWCARQAGIPTSIIKTNAWAGNMEQTKKTGNFGGTYYPKGTITPQKGDIVYYDGSDVNNSSGHVELVIQYNSSNNTIDSIGGNTGGGDGHVIRHNGRSLSTTGTATTIIGFERPNYSGPANPPAQNNDTELGINYPRPSGSPYLQSGSTGSGVSWLQTALNKANNAGLAVDGQFGSGTKQAVINFQKANGLTADGIAGPSTINKLVEVIKGKNNPQQSIKPKAKAWMSDSKMGNEVSSFEIGKWYYLCYKFYDENSGKLLSEVNYNFTNYKVTETIYNPDGSVFNTCTYDNSDNNWIGIKPSYTGTYKWELKLTNNQNGETATASKEFNVTHTHSYSSWSTTKAAICTSDGSKKRTCSICGASETQTVYATGHSYNSKIIPPTNTEKGYTLHTCSECGHSYKDNYTEFEFTASVGSINLSGFESKSVIFSYKNYSGNVTISWSHGDGRATTLTWGEWNNNTVALNIAGYAKGTEKITVTLKDTDTEKVIATKTITVTVTGIETKLNASSTSLSIDMSKNEKKGVTFSYENVPAATKYMNIRWVHGDNRATSLEWGNWENHTTTLYITGYHPGTENIKIEFFDSDTDEVIATKIIKVTVTCQHKFGSWTTSKSATCISVGSQTRTCSICEEEETQTISKTGHKYTTKIVASTYTEKGYTLHTCSLCGDEYKDNYTDMKVRKKGDLNSDDKCGIADAVTLQKYLIKSQSLTTDQFSIADINNDGKINVFDLILLKRMIINNK